jgi:hypothetical protein
MTRIARRQPTSRASALGREAMLAMLFDIHGDHPAADALVDDAHPQRQSGG